MSHYNYPRPALAPLDHDEVTISPADSPSPSIEFARVRGYAKSDDGFNLPMSGSHFNIQTGYFEDQRRASRMESPPNFTFGHPGQTSRFFGPPGIPAPMPQASSLQSRTPYYHSGLTDLPTTDQTYGNTGQLLQLTPHEARYPPSSGPSNAYDYSAGAPPEDPFELEYDDEEEKENTPPRPARVPGFYMTSQAMPRSSSYYPDDQSVWESTQASESRANLADPVNRPSEESYADTSVSGNRLSMPVGLSAGVHPSAASHADTPGHRTDQRRGADHSSASPDCRKIAETDEKKARKILEDKILEGNLNDKMSPMAPKIDKAQHAANMKELERLRQSNPSAVGKAVRAVADKLGNLSPTKPVYSPQSSFTKAARLGSNRRAHHSTSSETHGLLSYNGSPYMAGGLQFNDSMKTFQTAPRAPSTAAGGSIKDYSPLTPSPVAPPATVLMRDRAATCSPLVNLFDSAQDTPVRETIELRQVHKKKPRLVSRAAMSSQTELQPLQLVESTAASGVTGRLTDAQLAEAEPGWTTRPDFSEEGALARQISHIRRPASFVIQQADLGGAGRISLLMKPDDVRNFRMLREQKELTKPYYRACNLFPIAALLLGLGCFDFKMRSMTNGRIVEMEPAAKKLALGLYLPLGVIIYASIGLSITMIVIASR